MKISNSHKIIIALDFIYSRYKVTQVQMASNLRNTKYVRARIVLACLLKNSTNLSMPRISNIINKSHSSITSYLKAIKTPYYSVDFEIANEKFKEIIKNIEYEKRSTISVEYFKYRRFKNRTANPTRPQY